MGILPEQHAAAENNDPIRNGALALLRGYVETMEDYDAGFSIGLADHPHHEDWVKANELLRDAGQSPSALYLQLAKPAPAKDDLDAVIDAALAKVNLLDAAQAGVLSRSQLRDWLGAAIEARAKETGR